MIPGAATYRAVVGLIDHDPLAALTNGSQAVGIVVALAAGLAIAGCSPTPPGCRQPRVDADAVHARPAVLRGGGGTVDGSGIP